MDPNTALAAALTAARSILINVARDETDGAGFISVAESLAEHVEALDGWLKSGGFPPAAWAATDEAGAVANAPKTVQIVPGSEVESYTVAGLIQKLYEQVEIDPTRAADPVEIGVLGGGPRAVPSVVGATGNDDPAVGGPRRVVLYAPETRAAGNGR